MSREFLNYVRTEYFEGFREGSEDYGEFYKEILESTNVSERDAYRAVRFLDKGEIDKAEDLVEELL